MTRNALLICGILSSLLYAGMLVAIPLRWDDYHSASQTVSELSAIDAPTRQLWAIPGALYTVLVTGFGWGVWMAAAANRRLCVAGALIAAYGALGLVWPFAPMHLREVLAAGGGTLTDTLHLALASVTVLLMLLAIAFGARGLTPAFHRYSMVTLAVLSIFGALTFIDAPGLAAGLPTPWLGVWERINIGAFLLWIAAFAGALLIRPPARA